MSSRVSGDRGDSADERARRTGRRPGSPATREVILNAARNAFAAQGFAATSIRAIARAAQVDPALVHHYFGTKDDLFLATVALPINPADVVTTVLEGPADTLGVRLIGAIVMVWESELGTAMAAMLRTQMADPARVRALGEFVALQAAGRAVASLHDSPVEVAARTALVTSQILGVIVGRYLLAIPTLTAIPAAQLIASVGATLQRYLTDPLPEQP